MPKVFAQYDNNGLARLWNMCVRRSTFCRRSALMIFLSIRGSKKRQILVVKLVKSMISRCGATEPMAKEVAG